MSICGKFVKVKCFAGKNQRVHIPVKWSSGIERGVMGDVLLYFR